ncbi:MAG: D-alanine--D-alanine ligase, partial [Pseudomonadota bacterium]
MNETANALNIAILQGGPSAEAEVSHNSAQQVAQALATAGHHTTLVEIDTELNPQLAAQLVELGPHVVFPALHGPPGEDGTVQGFLEMLDLPYVGSDVRGSALAMDKAVAKMIFRNHGLPVLPEVIVSQMEVDRAARAASIEQALGPAVVIKPLNQGSAIGVTPLPNGGDLEAALNESLSYGDCLVEPYVMGKEITVGVLQTEGALLPHPVIEIATAGDEWYDYHNRYAQGASEHIIPARLPAATLSELQEIALRAHTGLGLRDLSRADFIVTDDHEITLLEVNTLPG